jgi:hypothetical protein
MAEREVDTGDQEALRPAAPEPLQEQADLTDAEGDDIREYTGEPVETEDGWVVPQQQNVGSDNEVGGGEWPDPDTPPVQPPAQGSPD